MTTIQSGSYLTIRENVHCNSYIKKILTLGIFLLSPNSNALESNSLSSCHPLSLQGIPFPQTEGERIILKKEDYDKISGDYCTSAIGKNEENLSSSTGSPTIGACSAKFSVDGQLEVDISGKKLIFTPDQPWVIERMPYAYSLPSHLLSAGHRSGNEVTAAIFSIDRGNLYQIMVSTVADFDTSPKLISRNTCFFENLVQSGNGIPTTSVHHAYPGDISGLIGQYFGFVNNSKSEKKICSTSVNSDGTIEINSFHEETPVKHSARLRGHDFDQVTVNNGIKYSATKFYENQFVEHPQITQVDISFNTQLNPAFATGISELVPLNVRSYCDFSGVPVGVSYEYLENQFAIQDGGTPACEATAGTNPINIGTGNKFQRESDYIDQGRVDLSFERYYNSDSRVSSTSTGAHWRSTFDRSIRRVYIGTGLSAQLFRADGRVLYFTPTSAGQWRARGDNGRLVQAVEGAYPGGWIYTSEQGDIEYFDVGGKLRRLSSLGGKYVDLSYDSTGQLHKVEDLYGRSMTFTYDASGYLTSMTAPSGNTYYYKHDEKGNLTEVSYPASSTLPVRKYLYEHPALANALTGIEDENGTRYATWSYLDDGRAKSSEHAGGVDKFTVTYGATSTAGNTVTDPMGSNRVFYFSKINGATRYTGQSQPAGAGCSAASSSKTYDVNGNVASVLSFNGNKTEYTYDLNRNLEIKRIEASGTSDARTISTIWHANLSVPVKIAEPKLITTYTYYDSGLLKSVSDQPTTDADGSKGFSATVTGTARLRSFEYDQYGNLIKETGPGGATDTVSYQYDSSGNLIKMTNALGHITEWSNYDLSGRANKLKLPNGLTRTYTYTARGQMASLTESDGESSMTTSFAYDAVGQLTAVTNPDGTTIQFQYDGAHRLTGTSDNAGNSRTYTLNALGKWTEMMVTNTAGTVLRKGAASYDALGRLKSASGASQ